MSRIDTVLTFWFGPPDEPGYPQSRQIWFKKDDDFDRGIISQFTEDHARAGRGDLDSWKETPQGCLALVIILDQFSRNMFRGDPRAFASDAKARQVANFALAQGYHKDLPEVMARFFYLPFEHSEDLDDQGKSLDLFRSLSGWNQPDSAYFWAVKHYEIIRRFGRFPHRNQILGRKSTPKEITFLKEPHSSF